MREKQFNIFFENEAALRIFAVDLAMSVKKGDFIALSGDLGAGKSTLARAFIRALAEDKYLEVPSPSFSLVQHYELPRFNITHADLYRLSEPQEIEELGLVEALNMSILLLEWPERAEGLLPDPHFSLSLDYVDEGRGLTIDMTQEAEKRLMRSLEIRAFLEVHGQNHAQRFYLAGDASSRRYEIIKPPAKNDEKYVLMDGAQMHPLPNSSQSNQNYAQTVNLAQDVRPFVGMARLLKKHDFGAPQIFSQDLKRGLLLLEHLGSEGIVDDENIPIAERYLFAAFVLADIHALSWSSHTSWPDLELTIPPYDRQTLYRETVLLLDWYLPYHQGIDVTDDIRQDYLVIWDQLIDCLLSAEQSLCLRDYHSPNLIWREAHSGVDKLGLIDFQDALIGPVAYDLASLAQDARATIPLELESTLIDAYCARRKIYNINFDEAGLRHTYPLAATQRITKILGLFVRLDRRDGKPDYLKNLPRLIDYLGRNFAHPDLSALRDFCHFYKILAA